MGYTVCSHPEHQDLGRTLGVGVPLGSLNQGRRELGEEGPGSLKDLVAGPVVPEVNAWPMGEFPVSVLLFLVIL